MAIQIKQNIAYLSGNIDIKALAAIKSVPKKQALDIKTLDFANVSHMDLVGAGLLLELFGHDVMVQNATACVLDVWNLAILHDKQIMPKQSGFGFLGGIGKIGFDAYEETKSFLSSIGACAVRVFKPFPLGSVAVVIKDAGINALPVIMTTALLLGVVFAYQSAVQLQKFGANIFVADLVVVSFTREIGPLIVAMLIAGRTGSAFTAKLGSMKLGEEIDAIRAMGLSPISLLVLPQIIGLMIALPLVVAIADIVGIFGGMIVAANHLDIGFGAFIERVYTSVSVKHYLVGLVKTPFFAFFISFIAYHRGMSVQVSAESLGKETTNSVVQAIFAVIAFDALFSVLAVRLGF